MDRLAARAAAWSRSRGSTPARWSLHLRDARRDAGDRGRRRGLRRRGARRGHGSSRRWQGARSAAGVSTREPYVVLGRGARRGSRCVDYGCKRSILDRLAWAGAAVDRLSARRRRRRARALRRRPALERPGRPGAARRRGRDGARAARPRAGARHLPRPPAARAGDRARDLQASRSATAAPTIRCSRSDATACSSRARTTASRSRRSDAREVTHVSLYDGTVEGLDFPELRARSVQFHPGGEARPARRAGRCSSRLGRGGGTCRGGVTSARSA